MGSLLSQCCWDDNPGPNRSDRHSSRASHSATDSFRVKISNLSLVFQAKGYLSPSVIERAELIRLI